VSGSGLFGIGVSGLLAYQRALQVAGHNIANVGTDGYSRQRLELEARPPTTTGAAAIGNGVSTTRVDRVADRFVEQRLVSSTSAEAFHRTYAEFAAQIDNLVADADAGLAPALDDFFAATQEVASDPTSTAARQQLIGAAEALVARFGQIQQSIDDQQRIANGRIGGTVLEINQLAQSVAELNERIIVAGGQSTGAPNDLLDKRDGLLRQLAERVSITTLEQSDGSINVYAGRGQALVVGTEATALSAEPSAYDPARIEIGFRNGATFIPVTDTLRGGTLGALLDVRDGLLDPAGNALGRVALGVTELFNETQRRGMDLNGALGTDLFARPELKVLGHQNNAATGAPSVTVTNVAGLTLSDYELRFDGSSWSLRRQSDGQQLASLAPGATFSFDGLSLDLAGITGGAAGDRFLLQPLKIAGDLGVRIQDPRAIAAALPVRATAAPSNLGSGAVGSLDVIDPANAQLRAAVDVQFTGGNFVAGAVSVPLDASGETTIDVNGWRLVVRGTPADGDTFAVRDNAGGVGDNRNALALAGLASSRTLGGGTASLGESYAELVADVGVKTRRAQINAEVQGQLLSEATAQRDAISGVNLDEEAADLIRFQQAYQASAQVIAAAGSMFDSLFDALRR
jgi:flagellar hook-associated protein 1 FlgK